MPPMIRRKITLGVVIGSRAFFSPAPCKAARDEVLAQLAGLGFEAVILPFEATANGAVQSICRRRSVGAALSCPWRHRRAGDLRQDQRCEQLLALRRAIHRNDHAHQQCVWPGVRGADRGVPDHEL